MKLYKTLTKTILIVALISLPLAWLLATNSGLNATLRVISVFSPISFTYKQAFGQIIGKPIELLDLKLEYQNKKLQIQDIVFDWRLRTLTAHNVNGLAKFLPKSELLADQDLILNKIHGHVNISDQQEIYVVELIGKTTHSDINCVIQATYNNSWDLKDIKLQIGNNVVYLKQDLNQYYTWDIKLQNPQLIFSNSSGAIYAHGTMQNLQSIANLKAQVNAKNFTLQNYKIKNLQGQIAISQDVTAPLDINLKADTIIIDQQNIDNLKFVVTGNLLKHKINASAKYESNNIKLNSDANVKSNIWRSEDLLLTLDKQQLPGNATYDIKKHRAELKIHSTPENYINADFSVYKKKLSGNLKLVADDITFLMQWLPDVTRLKGKFVANAKISGSTESPIIVAEAHLTDVTATLPHYGVKIKPMEVHIVADEYGKFTVNGTGQMRRGSGVFLINGYIEPFKPNMPNTLNIIGSDVEFINNQTAHLIASNNITLNYLVEHNRLDITGDVTINSGHITLQDKTANTVKSKDVVFTDAGKQNAKKLIAINPNVNLRIIEGVIFSGFGLNADISGKLNISQRHNAMYADGRITIKEGSFKLPGQKLLINKGRILYPAGTLLANPVLDLKMYGKSSSQETIQGAGHDVELYVQGTAHKPIITESGLTGKQDRALSRALITGSSVISGNLLQDKLKISEIGISTDQDQNVTFFDGPNKGSNSLRHKDIVVGRPLGKKFYLQYLHSIGEANQKVRLKYSLGRFWDIGVESGTQGGGADLSFSIERD